MCDVLVWSKMQWKIKHYRKPSVWDLLLPQLCSYVLANLTLQALQLPLLTFLCTEKWGKLRHVNVIPMFACVHWLAAESRVRICFFETFHQESWKEDVYLFQGGHFQRKVNKQVFSWLWKDYNRNCLLKGHHPIYKPLNSKQYAIDPSLL